MIPYMAQPRYPLNSQVLAIFFPFAAIPATPHYPKFLDRYSPQHSMLSFSLFFMTHTFFNFPFPTFTSFLNYTASPISNSFASPHFRNLVTNFRIFEFLPQTKFVLLLKIFFTKTCCFFVIDAI